MNSVSLCAVFCPIFSIYKMTTKSIKGVTLRLLPGQTEGMAVQEARMSGVPEVAGSRGPLWAKGCWWLGGIFLSQSQMNLCDTMKILLQTIH